MTDTTNSLNWERISYLGHQISICRVEGECGSCARDKAEIRNIFMGDASTRKDKVGGIRGNSAHIEPTSPSNQTLIEKIEITLDYYRTEFPKNSERNKQIWADSINIHACGISADDIEEIKNKLQQQEIPDNKNQKFLSCDDGSDRDTRHDATLERAWRQDRDESTSPRTLNQKAFDEAIGAYRTAFDNCHDHIKALRHSLKWYLREAQSGEIPIIDKNWPLSLASGEDVKNEPEIPGEAKAIAQEIIDAWWSGWPGSHLPLYKERTLPLVQAVSALAMQAMYWKGEWSRQVCDKLKQEEVLEKTISALENKLTEREIIEDTEALKEALAYMQGQTHFQHRHYVTVTTLLKRLTACSGESARTVTA